MPGGNSSPVIRFSQKSQSVIPKREDWEQIDHRHQAVIGGNHPTNGIIWYTDNSKMGESVDAGVDGQFPIARLYYASGKFVPVFRPEVFAICVEEEINSCYHGQQNNQG
ncbi:hypothetical protein JTB14_031017 [Gonioctena quinquepunctata]|nr:hypothetical protein JTB14_031017 [Gonioctena quinquepunctata]